MTLVESLTFVFLWAYFLPPLTSAPVHRPDMSKGADRVFRVSRSSALCPQRIHITLAILLSVCAYLSFPHANPSDIQVYSIRWSRTMVPVTMGSSICSVQTRTTRTKQWEISGNAPSTRSNKSIERFLICPEIYIGVLRCWYRLV